ncbi:hypothetical protein GQ457_18G008220 [Hibiscus cannabinus]
MSESRFAQINNTRGSSSEGNSVGMEGNFLRQDELQAPVQPQEPIQFQNLVQPPKPAQDPQNPPDVQTIQRECLLSMKEMFDQFVKNLKQEQSVVQVVAVPSRAPIDKLAQHQGYPFAGTIEEKPEEAEYWLEHITQIVTKQLSCLDEHKLKCAIALLVNEALSWWETTTLTTPTEKVTWEFFVEEFKKKYISEQHFEESRKKFLYLKQGRKPIGQYASEFCKYHKYGLEIREERSRQKAKRSGSNYIPGPQLVFKPPALINYDRPQWKFKKAKYHNENSTIYTPAPRSNFTLRQPTGIELAILKVSVNKSSFTLPVRNEGSKQVQNGNQGRGKGNHSKVSTHQEFRAPVRVYHIEGRNNEKSLEVITEESVQILDQEIKRLRNKRVPLVKVLWKNHGVEEVTWETEAIMQKQYPHLFDSGKNSRTNSLLGGGRIVIPRNSPS